MKSLIKVVELCNFRHIEPDNPTEIRTHDTSGDWVGHFSIIIRLM